MVCSCRGGPAPLLLSLLSLLLLLFSWQPLQLAAAAQLRASWAGRCLGSLGLWVLRFPHSECARSCGTCRVSEHTPRKTLGFSQFPSPCGGNDGLTDGLAESGRNWASPPGTFPYFPSLSQECPRAEVTAKLVAKVLLRASLSWAEDECSFLGVQGAFSKGSSCVCQERQGAPCACGGPS